MITVKRLKEVLNYDKSTGIWTRLIHKTISLVGKQAGSVKQSGYRSIKVDNVDYMSARLAWFYMTGEWPKHEVDHKDTDKLNDAWENLREATRTENTRNRNAKVNTITGHKGVKLARNGLYEARINLNGKYKYLGLYKTVEEAAHAYGEAAKDAYGEFARHS